MRHTRCCRLIIVLTLISTGEIVWVIKKTHQTARARVHIYRLRHRTLLGMQTYVLHIELRTSSTFWRKGEYENKMNKNPITTSTHLI